MKNNIFKKLFPYLMKYKFEFIFLIIFPYLMKYKFEFIFLIIIAIIGNLLTLVGPYLVGKGINEIHFHMEKANYIQLGKISILLLFSYITGAVLTLIQNIKMNIISQDIVNTMRKDGIEKIHKFPLKYFDGISQGNIITIMINDIDNISGSLSQIGTRVVVNLLTISTALFPLKYFDGISQGNIITIMINDIDNISGSLSQIGTRVVVNLLTISTALGIMLYISPSLTLIQIFLVTFAGYFLKKIYKKSREKRRVQQKYLGQLNGYVDEILNGEA